MSRIRIMGAQADLSAMLRHLLDFGRVHLDDPQARTGLGPAERTAEDDRERRHLRRILDDVDAAIDVLHVVGVDAPPRTGASPDRAEFAWRARAARRTRRQAERLAARRFALEDERAVLDKHQGFLQLFRGVLSELATAKHLAVYGVTLPASEAEHIDRVGDALRKRLDAEVSLTARALPSGDLAVLIAVAADTRAQMEKTLAAAGIPEIPLPAQYAGQTLGEAAPRMLGRLADIPREIAEVETARVDLVRRVGVELVVTRALAHDRLSELDAKARSAVTAHAFVLEGWVPSADVKELRRGISRSFDDDVVVEVMAREEWKSRPAPVILSNPRIFRPFEVITKMMPLPRYGTIDPTPFVSVTFPMLFGMILGDIGYGVVLLGLALVMHARTARESVVHTISEIAIPCAAFGSIFGVLYGELFGSLGRELFGLRPVLLDREEAVVAAALVAVGVGLAHVLLGLVLGVITAWRGEPRVAASRIVQFTMLVLVVLSLLAAVEVLPSGLFGPLGLTVLIGFPVLLALEGIVAPIEFFSTLGNVLSYVRIMALGTASVMLAVLANQMVGLFGSAVVGVLFALLFHVVNFALGLVSPTIHALRLHYVEFFRQFYSGGGQQYEPFAHWRPSKGGAA